MDENVYFYIKGSAQLPVFPRGCDSKLVEPEKHLKSIRTQVTTIR